MLGSRPLGFSVRVLRSRVLGGGAVVCGFTVHMFRAYPGIPQTGPEMSIRWGPWSTIEKTTTQTLQQTPMTLTSYLPSYIAPTQSECSSTWRRPATISGIPPSASQGRLHRAAAPSRRGAHIALRRGCPHGLGDLCLGVPCLESRI